MSELAASSPKIPGQAGQLVIAGAIIASAIILLFPDTLSPLAKYPDGLIIPFKDWVGAFMAWLKTNFTWLTRSLAAAIDVPLRFAFSLLAKGFKFGNGETAWILPRLSWLGVTFVMAWLGFIFGGLRLGITAARWQR